MRAAIAAAPVGDDQFGEDPSVNALQEQAAALLGKDAALWLPTGTMANQVALRVLTRPGDDVVVSAESHLVWHETGAGAANAGVQFTAVGSGGTFTAAEFLAARKPPGHMTYPPTTLVAVENTHNRGGGVVMPQEDVEAICAAARANGVATLLAGARLWNAAIATGRTPADLAAPFDVAWVALSKGWVRRRIAHRGTAGADRACGAVSADARRGDAAGWTARRGRHLCVSASLRASGRRSRERAAHRGTTRRHVARQA